MGNATCLYNKHKFGIICVGTGSDLMTLGSKLKDLRKKENLTQSDLAEKIFVTRNAISKWESDKGTPSIDSLSSLAKLFNTSIDELVNDELLIHDRYNLNKYLKYSLLNIFIFILLNGALQELTVLFSLSTIQIISIIVTRLFLLISFVYINRFYLGKRYLSIKQKRTELRITVILSSLMGIAIILTIVSTFS